MSLDSSPYDEVRNAGIGTGLGFCAKEGEGGFSYTKGT